MSEYQSALIQSLRGAGPTFTSNNPGVSFLPNPQTDAAPIALQRQVRAYQGMANRPPVLAMPAFVPKSVNNGFDDYAPPTGKSDNFGRSDLYDDRLASDPDFRPAAPIDPDFVPAIQEPGPLVDPEKVPVPDIGPQVPEVVAPIISEPLIDPDRIEVPDLVPLMPKVIAPISPDQLPAVSEPEPLIDPDEIEVPDLGPQLPQVPEVVQPISPDQVPSIAEPEPLIDPADIDVPDLGPLMPDVVAPAEPPPVPAETFPVPDQAPWEPVDLPPIDVPEPPSTPAESFPVPDPSPWEPIDLPPIDVPEMPPAPAEAFPVPDPAPWEPIDLPAMPADVDAPLAFPDGQVFVSDVAEPIVNPEQLVLPEDLEFLNLLDGLIFNGGDKLNLNDDFEMVFSS